MFFGCEISNEGIGGRRGWLTWRPWWLGKEHAEVNTKEANPRVKERNRRSRLAANAGEARLWWVLAAVVCGGHRLWGRRNLSRSHRDSASSGVGHGGTNPHVKKNNHVQKKFNSTKDGILMCPYVWQVSIELNGF